MAGPSQLSTARIERYRGYLRLLAEAQLDERVRARCGVSDVVQETIVEAWKARCEFRGDGNEEALAAWLRRILARNLANARRDHLRRKRDLRRERSIHAALNDSSARFDGWLASNLPSPSDRAQRSELLARLAAAMEGLSEAQRRAIALRYWGGHSLDDAAREMGRLPGDVAVLIHRGMKRLRAMLDEESRGSR